MRQPHRRDTQLLQILIAAGRLREWPVGQTGMALPWSYPRGNAAWGARFSAIWLRMDGAHFLVQSRFFLPSEPTVAAFCEISQRKRPDRNSNEADHLAIAGFQHATDVPAAIIQSLPSNQLRT